MAFCSNCGAELVDGDQFCSKCGAKVLNSGGVNAGGNNGNMGQNQVPFGNASQGVQVNLNGQAYNQSRGQVYNQGNPNQYMAAIPDDQFSILAMLFPLIWCLVKGLFDLALIYFLIGLILTPIAGTGLGAPIALFLSLATGVFVGRNGRYYHRIKQQQGISFIQAFKDPSLRKI